MVLEDVSLRDLFVCFFSACFISGNKVADMREMWQQRQKELAQPNSRPLHTDGTRCKDSDEANHVSEDSGIEESSRQWGERDAHRRKRSPQRSRHDQCSDGPSRARVGRRGATEMVRDRRSDWEVTGNNQAQQRDMHPNHGRQRQMDDVEADHDRWQMDEGVSFGASGVVEGGRSDSPYPQTVAPKQVGDDIAHINDRHEENAHVRAGARSTRQQADDDEALTNRHERSSSQDHGITDEELAAFLRSRFGHI